MQTHQFTAVIANSNRIISVQSPDEDRARLEIDRQLQKNPQRRDIWKQWQADGGHILMDPPITSFDESLANAGIRGTLRTLLAELALQTTGEEPDAQSALVFYAIEAAREALNEYDRGMSVSTDCVSEANGCPSCGERKMDCLVWEDDGENVRCATCGTIYNPSDRT